MQDPWQYDADRTTRHHAASIAPPILTIASDFTSDTETLAQYHARVNPRRPSVRVRVLAHLLATWR